MSIKVENFHLFSQFPGDIQRLIFEEAFEQSCRKAVDIALVSQEVRSWIEPLIYQCITLNRHTYTRSEGQRFRLFASVFRERSKPDEFYTKYVQRLFIDDLCKGNLGGQLLPLCSNLISLACWAHPNTANQTILRSLLSPATFCLPRLRRLSLYWGALPLEYQSFHHPLFTNLTHLDVDFVPEIAWKGLSSLQNLKYFNLDCISVCLRGHPIEVVADELESIIKFIVPHFPRNLRCAIILVSSALIGHLVTDGTDHTCKARQFYTDVASGGHDIRLLLGSSSGIPTKLSQHKQEQRDFVHHIVPVPYDLCPWTYLPRGHVDFWMEAEEIIKDRRRRKEQDSQRRRIA